MSTRIIGLGGTSDVEVRDAASEKQRLKRDNPIAGKRRREGTSKS